MRTAAEQSVLQTLCFWLTTSSQMVRPLLHSCLAMPTAVEISTFRMRCIWFATSSEKGQRRVSALGGASPNRRGDFGPTDYALSVSKKNRANAVSPYFDNLRNSWCVALGTIFRVRIFPLTYVVYIGVLVVGELEISEVHPDFIVEGRSRVMNQRLRAIEWSLRCMQTSNRLICAVLLLVLILSTERATASSLCDVRYQFLGYTKESSDIFWIAAQRGGECYGATLLSHSVTDTNCTIQPTWLPYETNFLPVTAALRAFKHGSYFEHGVVQSRIVFSDSCSISVKQRMTINGRNST